MEPLALVVYEKLLPGSQLLNRLQDLRYRVQSLNEPGLLASTAGRVRPMIVLLDLAVCERHGLGPVRDLRQHAGTQHVPVIGFGGPENVTARAEALQAGVTLVVSAAAVLNHLEECLDQALHLE
jgi:PleD family two-component response regulator